MEINTKHQTFEQWAGERNLPTDLDTMFEAQLLGARGLAGRQSNRSIAAQDTRFDEMRARKREAKAQYEQEVIGGKIIDPSGKVRRDRILESDFNEQLRKLESKVDSNEKRINFIEQLGRMSHQLNGKLKKGYQLTVNDYLAQKNTAIKEIETLRTDYEIVNSGVFQAKQSKD